MKLARSAFLCLTTCSLPLAVACGSNDNTGLFSASTAGSPSSSGGGSPGAAGTGAAHAGQSAGGSGSAAAGASGAHSVAGQANSGGAFSSGGAAGSSAGGGSNVGGTGVAGAGAGAAGASGGSAGAPAGGAGAGGAPSGGSAGAPAGGASTNGGAANAGSGGASVGGASGSAGVAGSGGASVCPTDAPPQDGTPCTDSTPDGCSYAGDACSCLLDGNGPGRKWSCYGTPDKCPTGADAPPTNGASCKTFAGALCPYPSGDYCVCNAATFGGPGADPKWVCNADPTPNCPTMRPSKGDLCIAVKECAYADRECFCNGTTWTCE